MTRSDVNGRVHPYVHDRNVRFSRIAFKMLLFKKTVTEVLFKITLCVSATHEYCSNSSRNRVNGWLCLFVDGNHFISANREVMFKINVFAESSFSRKSAYRMHLYGSQWCKWQGIPLRSWQKCAILENSVQNDTFQEGRDSSTVQNQILCVSATHECCSNPSRNRVYGWLCLFVDENR